MDFLIIIQFLIMPVLINFLKIIQKLKIIQNDPENMPHYKEFPYYNQVFSDIGDT